MKMEPQALYVQLGRLLETMPTFDEWPMPVAVQTWLAKASALIHATGNIADSATFNSAVNRVQDPRGSISEPAEIEIKTMLRRALAIAELNAPVAAQGAFIPAGNAFDALAALGKVLGGAKTDTLVVDPYMDERFLTDFAATVAEKVKTRILSDQSAAKPTLRPAVERWVQQHGAVRPLEARLSSPRALHDRLIIVDQAEAWILTQSINAFAARSPASISRSEPEVAAMKIPYYESVWAIATPL